MMPPPKRHAKDDSDDEQKEDEARPAGFVDFPAPELSDIKPQKNKENWVGAVSAEDDCPSVVCKWYVIGSCPFGDDDRPGSCNHASFKNAACWSLESPNKALSYLMQHITHSQFHVDRNLGYEDLVVERYADLMEKFGQQKIHMVEQQQTFEERDNYRKALARGQEANRKRQQVAESSDNKRQRVALVEREPSRSARYRSPPREDDDESMAGDSASHHGHGDSRAMNPSEYKLNCIITQAVERAVMQCQTQLARRGGGRNVVHCIK